VASMHYSSDVPVVCILATVNIEAMFMLHGLTLPLQSRLVSIVVTSK